MKLIDEAGNVYGRLTVIGHVGCDKYKQARWLCKCECGEEVTVVGGHLRTGHTKSCGCLRIDQTSLPEGESAFNMVFGQYRFNAKKRGYSFNLTKEEFRKLTRGDCYYCGQKPSGVSNAKRNNGAYIYSGVDRVDNSKGYEPDNTVSCCGDCNKHDKGCVTINTARKMVEFIENQPTIIDTYINTIGDIEMTKQLQDDLSSIKSLLKDMRETLNRLADLAEHPPEDKETA